MSPEKLKQLLEDIQSGRMSVEEGISAMSTLPFADIGIAKIDHHRALRTGFPEVVLGERKDVTQITAIVTEMKRHGSNILVTRADSDKARAVMDAVPGLEYRAAARCLTMIQEPIIKRGAGPILVVTAGTSDIDVAEEACTVAEMAGADVRRIFDAGVAGIHRLFHRLDELRSAAVIIVIAGMEGALASVVGGLVSCPVIAVPTSVGYGASFNGLAALLGMLNSCSAGITVVNIDNGFGAGYAAALMSRVGEKHKGNS
jgi:pyridinium-3,5-biscarboxylic acid mononucleotide synthase